MHWFKTHAATIAPMLKLLESYKPRLQLQSSSQITLQLINQYINTLQTLQNFEMRENSEIKSQKTIYANNYVNLEKINTIGFDLDYTLATYTVDLQSLIYNQAKKILIKSHGFPSQLNSSSFDPNFPIRGLTVDSKNGVLLKLSYLKKAGQQFVFYGKTEMTAKEIELMYGSSRHISNTVKIISFLFVLLFYHVNYLTYIFFSGTGEYAPPFGLLFYGRSMSHC